MKDESLIAIDPLAVGITRPALWMGVPLKLCFINLMIVSLGYVYVQDFRLLLLFPVFHGLIRWGTYRDPRWFEGFCQFFIKTPPTLNKPFWGQTNSYEPW